MAIQGTLTVTPEQLSAQSTKVRQELNNMQNRFADLKNLVTGTGAYWIGEAGDAHRQLYTARIGRIEEMFSRYREQVDDLERMAGVYKEAEAQAQSLADSLPPSTL